MDIEVELSRIIIDEASDQQVIVLKEKNGQRSLPIVIGIVEIMAIDRRLKGKTTIRPMTHDLLGNIIESMGGKIGLESEPGEGSTFWFELELEQILTDLPAIPEKSLCLIRPTRV